MYGSLSFLSLLIGICIYLLFRDIKYLLLIKWIGNIDVSGTAFIHLNPSIISPYLIYNLPDMLWFLSGILLLRCIWAYNYKEQRNSIFGFYVIGIIVEISQLSKTIPGTFDILDLFFMGFGAFIEGLLYCIFIKRRIVWKRNG